MVWYGTLWISARAYGVLLPSGSKGIHFVGSLQWTKTGLRLVTEIQLGINVKGGGV